MSKTTNVPNNHKSSLHNNGNLCVGGRFGYDLIHSKDRLVSPLMRKEGLASGILGRRGFHMFQRSYENYQRSRDRIVWRDWPPQD